MPIYATPGQSGYEECAPHLAPAGTIEMQCSPETANAIAQADGTWGFSADVIRSERDALLAACDFTQLPDAPLSTEQRARWVAYRQDLRDIPLQAGFPNAVIWPTAPEE